MKSLSHLEWVPQTLAVTLAFPVVNKNKVFLGEEKYRRLKSNLSAQKVPGKSVYRAVLSFSEEPSFLSKLNTCKGQRTGQTALAMFAGATSMQEKMQQRCQVRTAQFSKARTAVFAAFGRQTEQARGWEAVLNVEEQCLSHMATSPSLPYRGAATALLEQP